MIFTCPRCARSYAVPDGFAGLLCPCAGLLTPILPGAGAPSPASTTPESASHRSSSGLMDGGRGQGDVASVSTGRGAEKASQRSSQGQGKPIEAAAKDLPDDYKPDRNAQDRAEAWFQAKFFKRGGIGDNDWKPLVAACKTWGMPDKAKWRDWLKDKWDTDRAVAVKVLITAKAIEGPKGAEVPTDLKALYEGLKARGSAAMTLADIRAHIDAKATQEHIDKLLDLGLIYEPKADGGFVAISDPKGG